MIPIRINGREFSHITIDSREVTDGCLFVCIKGESFDGHDFAAQALAAGAAMICAESKVEVSGDYVYYVESTRRELLRLAGLVREASGARVVGVTGSVGKTTTKDFLHAVLSQKFNTQKTLGNLNNDIGVPKTLFRLEEGTQAAVVEMGMNHAGEIEPLSRAAAPDAAVITNIGRAHIGNFADGQAGIFSAKLELAKGLRDGAPLFVCGEDPLLGQLPSEIDGHEVVKYRAEDAAAQACVPGRHNQLNAAAASMVGRYFGLGESEIARGLLEYAPEGLRQRVAEIGGARVIIDCYNASPDSMRAAISVLAESEGARKLAVLGDMLELGEQSAELHREVGEYLRAAGVELVLTVGEYAAGYGGRRFESKRELAEELKRELKAGDVVLLKASRGMKFEEILEEIL